MSGFTTTATISELINKRPIRKRRKSFKATNKRKNLRATQKLLKLDKYHVINNCKHFSFLENSKDVFKILNT